MTDRESLIDQPAATIRSGEEIDLERLSDYLAAQSVITNGPTTVRQFPAGYSNLTYLITTGSDQFVLRRPPAGNRVKSAHDMSREFRVLSKLHQAYPPAPRPLLYCDDESVIGSPFYLMERRSGLILRRDLPKGLKMDSDIFTSLSHAFAEQFALLHRIDFRAIGLGDLGRPKGYVQRQIAGWTKRYEQAATESLPDIDFLASWLDEHQPQESTESLIHNDFKFDNLVLSVDDPATIVAVLDWEMATIGDPLMDLGSTLAYWIEPKDTDDLKQWAFAVTDRPGCLNRQQLAGHYLAYRNESTDHLLFYYAYGLFKLAGIVQQIYARYHHGHTGDTRFAQLNQMVASLGRQARWAIATGQISR